MKKGPPAPELGDYNAHALQSWVPKMKVWVKEGVVSALQESSWTEKTLPRKLVIAHLAFNPWKHQVQNFIHLYVLTWYLIVLDLSTWPQLSLLPASQVAYPLPYFLDLYQIWSSNLLERSGILPPYQDHSHSTEEKQLLKVVVWELEKK